MVTTGELESWVNVELTYIIIVLFPTNITFLIFSSVFDSDTFSSFVSRLGTCSGSDFEEGSSIRDRLTSATIKRPFNISYFEKIKGESSASVYLNLKTWTCDEMVNIMFKDSVNIIDKYIMNTSIKETGIVFEQLPKYND